MTGHAEWQNEETKIAAQAAQSFEGMALAIADDAVASGFGMEEALRFLTSQLVILAPRILQTVDIDADKVEWSAVAEHLMGGARLKRCIGDSLTEMMAKIPAEAMKERFEKGAFNIEVLINPLEEPGSFRVSGFYDGEHVCLLCASILLEKTGTTALNPASWSSEGALAFELCSACGMRLSPPAAKG